MTTPRKEILSENEAVYHCISRCVRRAFLCGYDNYNNRNYDHRKQWVHDRLRFLTKIFCIEVLGYALMSTHTHTMLRTRPDILKNLSNEEVSLRWLKLYPPRGINKSDQNLFMERVNILAKNKERIKHLRQRLGSISWFMKSLNEYIARRANKEDNCKGRFWEGRFKCQRLYDESAILSCAVYIDLNPIRAKSATAPENSLYTSAYERIIEYRRHKKEGKLWLCPISNIGRRRGFLSMSLVEYLNILDSTGREIREGKRGKISDKLAPILVRIGVNPEYWINTSIYFRHWFAHAAGSKETLTDFSKNFNKSWCKGLKMADRAYL